MMFSSIFEAGSLVVLGMEIYAFILMVKLATRGIKALDIYIDEKNNNKL